MFSNWLHRTRSLWRPCLMSWPIHKTSSTTLHKSLEKCFRNHLSDFSAPKFWDSYAPEFCEIILYGINIWLSRQILYDWPGTNIPECSWPPAYGFGFKMTSWTWWDESSQETFLNTSLDLFCSGRKWTVFPVNGYIAALLTIITWTAIFQENESSCFIPN